MTTIIPEIIKDVTILEKALDKREDTAGSFSSYIFPHESINQLKKPIKRVIAFLSSEKSLEDEELAEKCIKLLRRFSQQDLDSIEPPHQVASNSYVAKTVTKAQVEKYGNTFKSAVVGNLLGKRPKGNKGTTGSKIFRNYKGKAVGIFKPSEGTIPRGIIEKIIQMSKDFFQNSGQSNYLSDPKNKAQSQMLAERASYLFIKELAPRLNFVPETRIVEFNQKKGSFQTFAENTYKEAAEITFPKKPNKNDLYQFQMFCVLDYLIGNLDRHDENYLVKLNNQGHIEGIKMIDNGNSFITKNPAGGISTYFARKSQYKWKNQTISENTFLPEVIQYIKNLNSTKIKRLIKDLNKSLKEESAHTKDFFHESVIQALLERLDALKTMTEQDSPSTLGNIGTSEAISQIYSKKVHIISNL